MNTKLKKFVKELAKAWRENSSGLNAPANNTEKGLNGEKYAIKKLKEKHPKYDFVLTPNSKTPADIIGFKNESGFLHFALFQVKTSSEKSRLTKNIQEKDTLPILAELLKKRFVDCDEFKYYKKKSIFITIGYIGVIKETYQKIFKSCPYENTYSLNRLSISSKEKTVLKNKIHKI